MSTPQFTLNEVVLCYHGPLIYEARVRKTDNYTESNSPTGRTGPHYFVHYKGWKNTWDEWVPESRLMKFNETNILIQKRLNAENKEAQSAASASTKTAKSATNATSGRVLTAGGRKESTRGTKRGREEDDGSRRPDMRLLIPDILKVQLVDDWENVTKNSQLVSLPRKPNVSELLQEFQQWALSTTSSSPSSQNNQKDQTAQKDPKDQQQQNQLPRAASLLPSITSGLKLYFDRALGSKLLYRFERPQYHNQRYQFVTGSHVKVGSQKEMSEIYGAEHLLRLISNLPAMVAQSKMDPDSVNILTDYVHWLLKYMVQERDRIFLKEYEQASAQYQNYIFRS
ncbi:MRG-domain-containing protein [Fomitiporia mediterranea MF3/22]|uniref:MRG-domain-containing protein n=1 Tax=Fomitiporia mediterranea (strain MF3/22) TaxID=694068 RepID=UPI0004409036|nr:MRG-domain-containing protein [Fomitiporia mediterranea MF3/22]EJD00406.1 MRG-domain-containing protein [Fomitiporia mediterranea MF3/22]